MTNFRRVTIHLLMSTMVCCAPRSIQHVNAQQSASSPGIAFSWSIDDPQPVNDVFKAGDLPPGIVLPPGILQTDESPVGLAAGEPALIESPSGEAAVPPRSVNSPTSRTKAFPIPKSLVSSPASRDQVITATVASPITVSEMPSWMKAELPTATPPISIAATNPTADKLATQPPVVLAKSDSAILFPEQAFSPQQSAREAISGSPNASDGNVNVVDSTSSTPIPLAADQRPRILFQPAVPSWDPITGSILRPAVRLAGDPEPEILSSPSGLISESISAATLQQDARVPIPDDFEVDSIWVPSELDERLESFRERRPKPLINLYQGARRALKSQEGRDLGVGVERLSFALFEIDAAQPSNNVRFRFEQAHDWEFADRVEYLWSRIGRKGPAIVDAGLYEPSLDYQDLRLSFEVGGARFSATTELPLRFIDPTNLGNTGGMGDMTVTTKTVMMDGESLQLTQVLRTQMPTGSVKRGLGNGHVSMEPGFVSRYQWDCRTQIHNELKLWFPIGGEPGFSGPVLRYGIGYANVLYDSDTFAVIPTLECVGWSILSGQKSVGLLNPQSIDGENIINLYPGIRLVRDSESELGLFELGISGGTSVTERHWYRSVLRLDLRWTF